MLLLLNTTKTMNFDTSVRPAPLTGTPELINTAHKLVEKMSQIPPGDLAAVMSISDALAAKTHEAFSAWGKPGQVKAPALFAFTGLIFKHIDALDFNRQQQMYAQKNVRILSGLYGILKPFDLIEAYRLEMGYRFAVDDFSNLAQFWKKTVTDRLNKTAAPGEAIVSVASQEYMKALDLKKLDRPVILPVFKEKRPDGSYKNATVHAKKARGEILGYAIKNEIKNPKDLMEFSKMGWKAEKYPADNGPWIFTRPENRAER